MSLSPQITTALLVLGTVQLSRQLDLENPETINLVRVFYVCSNIILVAALFYIKSKIMAKPNNNTIEVDTATPSFSNPNPTGAKQKMTITEYDLSEWNSQLKQTLMPIALMVGLHFYIGFVQPLIIQSILPLKALYSTPIFQVYVLGKKAEGSLARPWKKPSPFEGLMPTMPTAPEAPQQEAVTNGSSSENTTTTDASETSESVDSPKPKTRKRNVPRDS